MLVIIALAIMNLQRNVFANSGEVPHGFEGYPLWLSGPLHYRYETFTVSHPCTKSENDFLVDYCKVSFDKGLLQGLSNQMHHAFHCVSPLN